MTLLLTAAFVGIFFFGALAGFILAAFAHAGAYDASDAFDWDEVRREMHSESHTWPTGTSLPAPERETSNVIAGPWK